LSSLFSLPAADSSNPSDSWQSANTVVAATPSFLTPFLNVTTLSTSEMELEWGLRFSVRISSDSIPNFRLLKKKKIGSNPLLKKQPPNHVFERSHDMWRYQPTKSAFGRDHNRHASPKAPSLESHKTAKHFQSPAHARVPGARRASQLAIIWLGQMPRLSPAETWRNAANGNSWRATALDFEKKNVIFGIGKRRIRTGNLRPTFGLDETMYRSL
jgi:hypothetical protein